MYDNAETLLREARRDSRVCVCRRAERDHPVRWRIAVRRRQQTLYAPKKNREEGGEGEPARVQIHGQLGRSVRARTRQWQRRSALGPVGTPPLARADSRTIGLRPVEPSSARPPTPRPTEAPP